MRPTGLLTWMADIRAVGQNCGEYRTDPRRAAQAVVFTHQSDKDARLTSEVVAQVFDILF